MAFELGYLHAAPGVVATSINDLRSLPDDAIVIVTTGSQGEPTSVLARLANRDHRLIHVVPGDTIVVSASPIPGNEGLINRTINNLFRQGANVLYGKIADVHVHGHGSQEELKMMISLIRPHFFVPVHGEHRQLVLHSRIAESLGIPPGNSFVLEDGDILEVGPQGARVTGKVPASFVYVDGLGVGDIGQVVLRDRRLLSRDGILVIMLLVEKQTGAIVGQPDVISRGFIDVQESGGLIEEVKDVAAHAAVSHGSADITLVNSRVKDALAKFLYQQTKRRPMILPITVEV